MTTVCLIMTSAGLIMTSAGLIMLFRRFRKWVLVHNYNKNEAKLDNYVRILCTYNVHFYDLCSDFCSRCTPYNFLKTELWNLYMFGKQQLKMSQCGHYTMTCGRYIKRRNMSGKCLFLPLKGSNFHLKYDFLTPGGPLYLPTKYWNFEQSPLRYKKHPLFLKYIHKLSCSIKHEMKAFKCPIFKAFKIFKK